MPEVTDAEDETEVSHDTLPTCMGGYRLLSIERIKRSAWLRVSIRGCALHTVYSLELMQIPFYCK